VAGLFSSGVHGYLIPSNVLPGHIFFPLLMFSNGSFPDNALKDGSSSTSRRKGGLLLTMSFSHRRSSLLSLIVPPYQSAPSSLFPGSARRIKSDGFHGGTALFGDSPTAPSALKSAPFKLAGRFVFLVKLLFLLRHFFLREERRLLSSAPLNSSCFFSVFYLGEPPS